MTVMERHAQVKSSNKSTSIVSENQHHQQQQAMASSQGTTAAELADHRRSSITGGDSSSRHPSGSNTPRKGSMPFTPTPNNNNNNNNTNLPNTSNLSLSSTTSSNSSSNSKPSSSKHAIFNSNNNNNNKQSASPPSSASRRQSGNSITIKVTNEHNADFEISGDRLRKEHYPQEEEEEEEEGRRGINNKDEEGEREEEEEAGEEQQQQQQQQEEQEDQGDEAEDETTTTSNSFTNETSSPARAAVVASPPHSSHNHVSGAAARLSQRKKSKEKKKFVRSAAQQQHHLVYQESEDLPDEQQPPRQPPPPHRHHRLPAIPIESNMNSAFDELFAAAQQGDSSKSAAIEAKMAAEAAEALAKIEPPSPKFINNSTSVVSNGSGGIGGGGDDESMKRTPSFRGSRPRAFSRLLRHRDPNLDPGLMLGAGDDVDNNDSPAARHLGSPQQLTRSCSCKRPGSFKKMRSKNASPNRQAAITAANAKASIGVAPNSPSSADRDSKKSISPGAAGGQRRGTQCSVTLLDDFEARQQQSRAGSLPFENFIRPQTLAIPSEQIGVPTAGEPNGAEVYRVRQFVTSKGAVINRGDSFKRSFKRSNQSLSSSNGVKKAGEQQQQDTPTNNQLLNLPDQVGLGYNKTSSSSINEASLATNATSNNNNTNNLMMVDTSSYGLKVDGLSTTSPVSDAARIASPSLVKTYVVYVLGAPTVGKNALIKQFKTSEYRGTYDICPHQSTDDESDEGVSILLDGIESKLQFTSMDIDMIKTSSVFELTKDNDAFIVVYSISDKSSFNTAIDLLKSIRSSESKTKPVILVGNKSDLVRKRSINREDGGLLALKYGSKFVETSVAINDKVDDLLAGILKQIRLGESLERELEAAARANNEQETSFTIGGGEKKHVRNYSDAQLHDLVKKKSDERTAPGSGFLSFKSNTLSRKFFKSSKNREISTSMAGATTSYNTDDNKRSGGGTKSSQSMSFFHKIYNSIFKKKSNQNHLRSVEDLFSLPYTVNNRSSKKAT